MKKYILILFFIQSLSSISQKYQPFDTTMSWRTIKSNVESSGVNNCYSYFVYRNYVQGYIINNGKMWHKVYAVVDKNNFHIWNSEEFCPSAVHTQTQASIEFMGYFSNDSLNRRLFYYKDYNMPANFVASNAHVQFDFTKPTPWQWVLHGQLIYSITQEDSVEFFGNYHKMFVGTLNWYHHNYYAPSVLLIEGIGSSIGVFDIHQQFPTSTYLSCVSKAGKHKRLTGNGPYIQSYTKSFDDVETCVYFPHSAVSILENEINEFKIYPSPSSGVVFIEMQTNEPLRYTVKNSLGQVIRESTFQNDVNILYLNDLPHGVYFLNVVMKGQTISRKIVFGN